ncbi:SDR family oxidoreductase [Blastococcus sp. SYSU D00695]
MDIAHSTVFITGGTSGIGLGLAQRLMAAGSTVVVGGRRTDRLARIAEELPGIGTQELDVSDPASIAAAAEAVTAAYPELDALVTTAGIMLPEDLTDPAHLDVAQRTVDTNLLGTIRSIDAFLPALLRRPRATVMTVSSGLAFVPMPLTPTYSATKAAVHSYTQALRVQLAGRPVQVTELVPPAVRTDLMGQRDSAHAMPLEEYLDEVMGILTDRPDAEEVLVERVRPLRFAEAEGRHDDVLAGLSRYAA